VILESAKTPSLWLLALLLAGTVAGCSAVLGIDDAHVDPLFGASHSGSGGADGGTSEAGMTAEMDDASQAEAAATEASVEAGAEICATYCDQIMKYCKDDLAQYIDIPQCLKVCSLFPAGTVGGPDSNTAACRLKYSSKAWYANGSERDAYCRKAGPGSDGTCGTICEGYCTLMIPTCTAARTPPFFFASMGDCMNACDSLADAPPYTVADGTLPDRNDAQCRLFHACTAVMDPDEHCEHAMGVTMCDAKPDAGGQ
jgi:hypothetical protein